MMFNCVYRADKCLQLCILNKQVTDSFSISESGRACIYDPCQMIEMDSVDDLEIFVLVLVYCVLYMYLFLLRVNFDESHFCTFISCYFVQD